MAQPLKDMYNETFLMDVGNKINGVFPSFLTRSFVDFTMSDGWEDLELKARIRRITDALGAHLPQHYPEALKYLFLIDEQCVGFPYLFFPDFVEKYGQDEQHWELSMEALERFTCRSSAEFAVRPFILKDPERMMTQMTHWSSHDNEHVRRLASEGCRPRLPWGQALPVFKLNPAPVLELLTLLKEDPSLYVRKSVANNLNDIVKDHPDEVIAFALKWKGTHPYTDWIIRHGCRTLIRRAHPSIMKLFGYTEFDHKEDVIASASLSITPTSLCIGENSELSYEVQVNSDDEVKLRIEYGIDFVKSGGKLSRKLFLLSDKTVAGQTLLQGKRTHRWANLTTRRHYAGMHRIVLMVNGQEVASDTLQVSDPKGSSSHIIE
ncbi:3-methyladenine DNA glycosylase AlkC [Paenibacillus shirakamiensis]|uniref:3-methyladenine DNA glycosylase AlkC n=1 Tax=Paenibacillus shirakamiensis TaxID=1265935 RepID=A0ABS4JGY5_9BACL|nr:DNA alkylation repair protein [Paenibacillus shirakamiensis]MBP2000305.1 3-methyladenine DNA glycosylase AlkC [Paenibacillus shirakamiensis]